MIYWYIHLEDKLKRNSCHTDHINSIKINFKYYHKLLSNIFNRINLFISTRFKFLCRLYSFSFFLFYLFFCIFGFTFIFRWSLSLILHWFFIFHSFTLWILLHKIWRWRLALHLHILIFINLQPNLLFL